jgi:hypothetical protein
MYPDGAEWVNSRSDGMAMGDNAAWKAISCYVSSPMCRVDVLALLRHCSSASSPLARVCGIAGRRRSSTTNATHVPTRLPKTSETSARGPVDRHDVAHEPGEHHAPDAIPE